MSYRSTILFASLGLLVGVGGIAASSAGQPRTTLPANPKCDVKEISAPEGTTITGVKWFDAPVGYCRIDGYVTTTNPGPNRVNFMVALPQRHNGRYVFTVQGGAAGFVPDPSDVNLQRGYAIASTDKGVRVAHGLDFSFRKDPVQALDWGGRGVHVAAIATQALTRGYYGEEKFHRYATGCSGGGDGTLTAAEVYPSDFDGYVGGAMTTAPLEITHIWGAIAQRLSRDPSSWISPEEYKHIDQVLLAEYDAADGAKDGLIWRPEAIVLHRASFPFLSDAQFGTLQFIRDGLKPELGTWYPGYWFANTSAFPGFLTGMTRPPWTRPEQYPAGFMVTDTSAKALNGANYSVLADLDYGNRSALVADRVAQEAAGRHRFNPANLAGLRKSGGKLILWAGMADQAVPPANVKSYSDEATRIFGKAGEARFVRTFFVPGLHHCSGGVGAPTDAPDQLLEAMANWVEKGQAPETVVVGNPERKAADPRQAMAPNTAVIGAPTRTYRLCAYPKKSTFVGGANNARKLDVNDARNWRCET